MKNAKASSKQHATTQQARAGLLLSEHQHAAAGEAVSSHESAAYTEPSFRTRPWVRVVSVVMSFLLAVTMFDTTGLSPLVERASADPAPNADVPTLPGTTDALATDAQDGADENGSDSDSADQVAGEDTTDSPDQSTEAADEAAAGVSEGEDASASEPETATVEDTEENRQALLPEGLVSADRVLPQVSEDTEEIDDRFTPSLVLFGAPISDEGTFYVKKGNVSGEYELGNLLESLEGGVLGGSTDGDAVILTFDIPYLYTDAEGNLASTYSEESWKLQRGIDPATDTTTGVQAPMRAALFADDVFEGWSVWQEHEGSYKQLTKEDLQAGVSGKIVLRYEGEPTYDENGEAINEDTAITNETAPNARPGALSAAASLPNFEFGLVGDVPADQAVEVSFGYEAHSFTPQATEEDPEPETLYGTILRKNVGTFALVNDETTAKATFEIESFGQDPTYADGQGYAQHLVHIAVPEDGFAAESVALSVAYPADWRGVFGQTLEDLMAYKVGADNTPEANVLADGSVDTSEEARDEETFVGVPGQRGVLVYDVTDLTDEQRASLDPKDAASFDELGLSPVSYHVAADARLQLQLTQGDGAISAGTERVLYVAAPYSADQLEQKTTNPDQYKAAQAVFDVQTSVKIKSHTFSLTDHRVMDIAFVRGVDTPTNAGAGSDDGNGAGEDDGEGGEDDPDADAADAPNAEGEGDADATVSPDDAQDADQQITLSPESVLGNANGLLPGVVNTPLYGQAAADGLLNGAPELDDTLITFLYETNAAKPLFASGMIMPQAEGSVAGLLDPNLTATAGGGQSLGSNMFMIKDTDQPTVTMDATPRFTDGYLGTSSNVPAEQSRHAVVFTLYIPYLYFDANGVMQETYDKAEWDQNQASAGGNPLNNGQRLTATIGSDFFTDQRWALYSEDLRMNITNYATLNTFFPGGTLTGRFQFTYVGPNRDYRMPRNFGPLTMNVKFMGNIPENTGGTIMEGVKWSAYTNANGETTTSRVDEVIQPGAASSTGSSRRVTYIKTNLDWTPTVKCVSEPILWDRYNYMAYEVEVKNVSESADSVIDYLGFIFNFPSSVLNYGEGMTTQDVCQWSMDPSGNVSKVERPSITAGLTYTGLPKQGGILVYDVTDTDPDTYAKLDMDDFHNADELGLQQLTYTTAGQDGQMSLIIHPEASDTDKTHNVMGGVLQAAPEGTPADQVHDKKKFLIALPFTTNFVGEYDPTSPSGISYKPVELRTAATVYFGGRGEGNDYAWTKQTTVNSTFKATQLNFEQSKYVVNPTTGSMALSAEAPLGYPISYVVDGSTSNGSNVPLFGRDLDTTFGAELVDQLPSGFELQGLDITVNRSSQTPTAADPTLEDWYDLAGQVVQFEVTDKAGKTSWETLSVPVEVSRTADSVVYRLGHEDPDSAQMDGDMSAKGIAQLLEERGIAAIPRKTYPAGQTPAKTFTGKFRLLYKSPLPKNVAIASSLRVTGTMRVANQSYTNTAQTLYGERRWVAAGAGQFMSMPHESEVSSATFNPIVTRPQVTARAYSTYNGDYQTSPVGYEKQRKEALVKEPDAGWRFYVSNSSKSKMEPATFTVAGLAQTDLTNKRDDFTTRQVRISKAFLQHASISNAVITYYPTTDGAALPLTITLTEDQIRSYIDNNPTLSDGTVNPTYGDALLPRSLWRDGYFSSIVFNLNYFEGNAPVAGTSAFVEINGTPTRVQDIIVTGTFATNYGHNAGNQTHTQQATLVSMYVPIRPTVTANYGYNDGTRTYTNANDTSTSITRMPYRWGDQKSEEGWYSFALENNSDYLMRNYNMDIVINDMVETTDSAGNAVVRGFIPYTVRMNDFHYGEITDLDGSTHLGWMQQGDGIVDYLEFYDNSQTLTGDADKDAGITPVGRLTMDDIVAGGYLSETTPGSGSYTLNIPLDELYPGKLIKTTRVHYTQVRRRAVKANNTASVVYMLGRVDTHGTSYNERVTANVSAYPTTNEYGSNMLRTGSTTMHIQPFTGTVTAQATKPTGVRPNPGSAKTGGNGASSTSGDYVEIANYAEGVGYTFTVKNPAAARSDNAVVSLDILSLSDYLDVPVAGVRGFWSKQITFDQGLFNIGTKVNEAGQPTAFKEAKFFFRATDGTHAPTGDAAVADVTLSADELRALFTFAANGTGTATLDLTSGAFAAFADQYLERVDLVYDEIDPVNAAKVLKVDVKGTANWWYQRIGSTDINDLHARMTIKQNGEFDTKNSFNRQTSLVIFRPALELHTFGQYGTNNYTDTYTYGNSANSDGSRTRVTVPYDRDFKMWARVENERNVSTLDDVDMTVNMPLKWESVAQFDGSTVNAWTGFHTTKITVTHSLFETFENGTVGTIELVGYPDQSNTEQRKIVLEPTDDYTPESGIPRAFKVKSTSITPDEDPDGRFDEILVTEDGLQIGEEFIYHYGIANLKTCELHSWKDMDFADSAAGNGSQNIIFDGFHDSNFATVEIMSARTTNYLNGLRTPVLNNPYTVVRTDDSDIYVSKMYFDAVSRAGLYDDGSGVSGTNRFNRYTEGSNDSCHWRHTNASNGCDGERNAALEVGYKSQVSLMSDFRQVNNGPQQNAPEWSCGHNEQQGMPYVGSLTYNSGALLHITQNVPSSVFDAYYVKIRSAAVPYVEGITVNYTNGKTLYVSEQEIRDAWADGSAYSKQTDINGQKYFRLNLLKTDDDGNPVASFGSSATEDAYARKDGIEDYNEPDEPGNPVKSITYDVSINQNQFANAQNLFTDGTFDANGDAWQAEGNPDYGTWYGISNGDWASWVNNMAFEVTGRTYRITGSGGINSQTAITMEVGEDEGGNVRPQHKAVKRFTEANKQNNDGVKSNWAYQDYHRYGDYWSHLHHAARMRHLISNTSIIIVEDGNYVRKDTVTNAAGAYGNRIGNYGYEDARFADDYHYAISFYRKNIRNKFDAFYDSYDWRNGDQWWDTYVSFADRVTLTDTLPTCFPDNDLEYYGYLSTGFKFLPGAGVWNHLKTYENASITLTTQKWNSINGDPADPDAVTDYSEGATRVIVVKRDGQYLQTGTGDSLALTKISDQGIDYMAAHAGSDNNFYLKFGRPDENEATDIKRAFGVTTTNPDGTETYTRTNGEPATVELEKNEFVKRYTFDLGPYYGNGDTTSEITGKPRDLDAAEAATDFYLMGRPYIYKGQINPRPKSDTNPYGGMAQTDGSRDAKNNIYASYYRYNDSPLTPRNSINWRADYYTSDRPHRYTDDAYYLGYLIPFAYRHDLSAKNGNDNDVNMYDYKIDNKEPNVAEYEVRFWNDEDRDKGIADRDQRAEGSKRITHISGVTLTNDLNDSFRLQKIYMPSQFVMTDPDRDAMWFGAGALQVWLNGSASATPTISLTWQQMIDEGILSDKPLTSGSHAGDYVIDLEKYLRNHYAELGLAGVEYEAVEDTNTLPDNGSGWAADPSVNHTYAQPWVSKFSFRFDSPNADRAHPETMLDSGEYLSASRQWHWSANASSGAVLKDKDGKTLPTDTVPDYTFAYDGVYVDRTVENFKGATETTTTDLDAGKWDTSSTPTFCKDGNAFDPWERRNTLTSTNVSTKDPNFDKLETQSASTQDYNMYHRLGLLETSVTRGKTITAADGTKRTVFAYDKDDASLTSPESYNPDAGVANDITNGNLYSGDYVEYILYMGAQPNQNTPAGSGAALPLEQLNARFEANKGQRIVGWEIATQDANGNRVAGNTTGHEVTAWLTDAAGGSKRKAEPQTDLSYFDASSVLTSRAFDGEGTDPVSAQAVAGATEGMAENRNLLFSVSTYDADNPTASQIKPGTGVYIRVITQMTDELETVDDYNTTDNEAYTDNEPAYKGQDVRATLYAAPRPLHGFTQYRSVPKGIYGTAVYNYYSNYNNQTSYHTDTTSNGSGVGPISYSSLNAGNLAFDGKLQLTSRVYSNTRFHNHTNKPVTVDAQFTTNTLTNPNQKADGDGNPAQLTVTGIKNYTQHTNDVRVTVRFTNSNDGGDPAGLRMFELTEKPYIAASNTTVKQEGGKKVPLRYRTDMPASKNLTYTDESGATQTGRPPIKIEYYDAEWNVAAADVQTHGSLAKLADDEAAMAAAALIEGDQIPEPTEEELAFDAPNDVATGDEPDQKELLNALAESGARSTGEYRWRLGEL